MMMKLNRLETHDRMLEFNKQWETINQGCLDCIRNVPNEITSPFYVFAHARTVDRDEQVSMIYDNFGNPHFKTPSMRLIWSPRITKPQAQSNSYLFLAQKNTDTVRILWLIPAPELWQQYEPGKMTHNPDVWTSIVNYKHHKAKLNEPDADGPTAYDVNRWRQVMAAIAREKRNEMAQARRQDTTSGKEDSIFE